MSRRIRRSLRVAEQARVQVPQLFLKNRPGGNRVEFKRDMSDDLPNSDVADQLHADLFVKPPTDRDNTGFSTDLEKGASVDDEWRNPPLGGFSYSLVRPIPAFTAPPLLRSMVGTGTPRRSSYLRRVSL
jgi:hypothetical protein